MIAPLGTGGMRSSSTHPVEHDSRLRQGGGRSRRVPPVAAHRSRSTVLVVDDGDQTRRPFEAGLRLGGFTVITAHDSAQAVRMAREVQPDVVVLDFGPSDDALVAKVSALLSARDQSRTHHAADPRRPAVRHSVARSAAERWVDYVLRASKAERDPKTLTLWAREAAVSYTTLCANCQIMRIRPLDARDFMRVLRVLTLAGEAQSPPEVFLDVSDTRTVRTLSLRAGVHLEAPATSASVAQFLSRQRFVADENQGLHLLRAHVGGQGSAEGDRIWRGPART